MKDLSLFIDEKKITAVERGKVYNSLKNSESSEFYEEVFSESFETKKRPELYDQIKRGDGEEQGAYNTINEIVSFIDSKISEDSVVIEIGGGVAQKRSGNAYKKFKNYYPLDISKSSITRYSEEFDKIAFVSDAEELPFNDQSIDCIFTHTFLEHPLRPEKVLDEIVRVLKPGGIVVHHDAWFCRWWHKYGIVGLEKFSNLNLKEKFVWFAAKITEIPVFRIPPIIIKRFFSEIFHKNPSNLALRYKKLEPNYELHLGCDEDAASSIDPLDVIRFYESRGFSTIPSLSFKQRLFHPNKYIILKKKS